jgi:hypothetical protein
MTFNSRSWTEGGTVPLRRRSFSHFSCVSSREMVILICSHTHALLDDGLGGGVLQVERVLSILGHCS